MGFMVRYTYIFYFVIKENRLIITEDFQDRQSGGLLLLARSLYAYVF